MRIALLSGPSRPRPVAFEEGEGWREKEEKSRGRRGAEMKVSDMNRKEAGEERGRQRAHG